MSSKRIFSLASRAAAIRAPGSISRAVCRPQVSVTQKTASKPSPRFLSSSTQLRKEAPQPEPELKPSTLYNFADIQEFSAAPRPDRIIIDVREPSELLETGTIPTSKNVPISSSPDAFFLSPEEFEDKFGFERPGKNDEVVFFCKAGVRSKAAARMAQQGGFGGKTSEYPGSWLDWVKSGGQVQKP